MTSSYDESSHQHQLPTSSSSQHNMSSEDQQYLHYGNTAGNVNSGYPYGHPQQQQYQANNQKQTSHQPLRINGSKSSSSSPGYSPYYHYTHHQSISSSNNTYIPYNTHQGNANNSSHGNYMSQSANGSSLGHPAGRYESHWPLYSLDWAHLGPSDLNLIAVTTYCEDLQNRFQILQASNEVPGLKTSPIRSSKYLEFNNSPLAEHLLPYPCTKIGWAPPAFQAMSANSQTYPLITTGDCLRLFDYNYESKKLTQRCALANKSKANFMPPITSFDWNAIDPNIAITSSIDTTCTIWDISTSTAKTQLIAHDNEVYDVCFLARSTNIFGSVGADGSVRMFDQRSLDHSTIIYDPPNPVPLVKIEANPSDSSSLAILASDSNEILILDTRMPGGPVASLKGHSKSINSIRWAPVSSVTSALSSSTNDGSGFNMIGDTSPLLNSHNNVLVSGSDDCQVIIWDTSNSFHQPPKTPKSPYANSFGNDDHKNDAKGIIAAYTDSQEVNGVCWNKSGNWVALTSGRGVQLISL